MRQQGDMGRSNFLRTLGCGRKKLRASQSFVDRSEGAARLSHPWRAAATARLHRTMCPQMPSVIGKELQRLVQRFHRSERG